MDSYYCEQNVMTFKDINTLNMESFLSDYVKEIVTNLSISDIELDHILDNELTLNWDKVSEYIPKEMSYNNESNEGMIESIVKTSPLINSVYKRYDKLSNENMDQLIQLLNRNLFWTQKLSINFIESLKLLKENNNKRDVNNILSLQMISSSLEQSLGNLVLTKVGFVPPLLKDLLTLPELSEIVGNNTIRLLQLTMGPPFTINIRNILWHGFVSHEDIDQRFAYFLLCICVTIGYHLDKQFRDKVLPQRPLTVFSEQLSPLNGMFPLLDSNDLNLISKNVLEKSPFILKRMLSLWKYAFHLYNNQKFGYCIAIIFPQLECCLRYIYSSINDMNYRIMTAIAREYYTTFAEILSQKIPDSERKNNLYEIFNQNVIELLFDLVIIPDGPRIRDKLSHGQIDIFAVEKYVANHVICVAISCLVLADIELNNKRESKSVEIVCKIIKSVSNYKCLFHPISQLRTKVIEFASSLSDWRKSSMDENICNSKDISKEMKNILKILQSMIFDETLNYDNSEKMIQNKLEFHNLNILSNSYSESEVVILRQIVDNILKSSQNIRFFLELRKEQFLQKELRSRQRLNYFLMLKNIKLFREVFLIILLSLYLTFINTLKFDLSEDKNLYLKNLRYFLYLSQNMNSNSCLTVNKWDKCIILCEKLYRFLSEFLTTYLIKQ